MHGLTAGRLSNRPPVPCMRQRRGTTLVELLVGLVIIAVAMAGLATTLPLLTQLAATEDAEQFARDGRGCGEVLLAVYDAGSLDLSCPAHGVTPGSWADAEAPNATDAADALNAACARPTLTLSCSSLGGAAYDEVRIEWSAGGMTPLVQQFPRMEEE